MNPKDWKNRSEIKLPWKPNKFLILVSLGKIKLGSSGEDVVAGVRTGKNVELLKKEMPKSHKELSNS